VRPSTDKRNQPQPDLSRPDLQKKGERKGMHSKSIGPNNEHPVAKPRILLVDDNDDIRAVFQEGLESRGFEVVQASSVNQALSLISTEKFDVLLTDLHMPGAGDGLTVVSAMRHAHPQAITLVQSGYPAMQEAATTILLQADEILAKPLGLAQIVEIIKKKLSNPKDCMALNKERVATILQRDLGATIEAWMSGVTNNAELNILALSPQDRTGHLRLLLNDLIRRLRLPPTSKALDSSAARDHGVLRHKQGYTVEMVVEESRILQVSIFGTLQKNLGRVDFSTVLLDVMAIADEVDSQLKQAVVGFMESASPKLVSSSA
jgi:CheY-like chemotaxis protein